MYHPASDPLLSPVTCEHFDCDRPATDGRGGFRFCLGHFFRVLQWEQVAA